jgi:hypothetical protein
MILDQGHNGIGAPSRHCIRQISVLRWAKDAGALLTGVVSNAQLPVPYRQCVDSEGRSGAVLSQKDVPFFLIHLESVP